MPRAGIGVSLSVLLLITYIYIRACTVYAWGVMACGGIHSRVVSCNLQAGRGVKGRQIFVSAGFYGA